MLMLLLVQVLVAVVLHTIESCATSVVISHRCGKAKTYFSSFSNPLYIPSNIFAGNLEVLKKYVFSYLLAFCRNAQLAKSLGAQSLPFQLVNAGSKLMAISKVPSWRVPEGNIAGNIGQSIDLFVSAQLHTTYTKQM